MNDHQKRFVAHIHKVLGFSPTEPVELRKWMQFKDGDSKTPKGWYRYNDQPNPMGVFGDWRDGVTHTWHTNDIAVPLTDEDKKKASDAAMERMFMENSARGEAAQRASELYTSAEISTKQTKYMKAKLIESAMIADKVIVVPLHDINGVLLNVQRIFADGSKYFLEGGRVKGCFHRIGDLPKTKRVILCEGYATGVTLSGKGSTTVLCCMTCGNLKAVACEVRKKHPNMEILIAADNDSKTAGNPGVFKAFNAAKEVKAMVAVPVFNNPQPGDFNDLHSVDGKDAVEGQLAQAWHNSPLKYTNDEVVDILVDTPVIDRTAALKRWKEYTGLGVGDLRDLVAAREQKPAAEQEDILKPWEASVDTATVLDELMLIVPDYIKFSDREAVLWSLWICHTWIYETVQCLTPILNIQSATKRCGKSQCLRLTAKLVKSPKLSAGISGPAIYRTIEQKRPTLLIDEADNVVSKSKEDLLAAINAGNEPDAVVTKCVGDNHEPKDFSTYCPKVLAGIGARIDTLEDRSIPIVLRRKNGSVKVKRLRGLKPRSVCRRLLRWSTDRAEAVKINYFDETFTKLPEELNDRQQDCMEVLLAIADDAGEEWSKRARMAAITVFGKTEEVHSIPEMLIHDLYRYHTSTGKSQEESAELVEHLNKLPEAVWKDLRNGHGINERKLANILKEFGLHSKDIRTATGTKRGYVFEQFEETFSVYAVSGATECDNATSIENIEETRRTPVAHERDKCDASATQKANETSVNRTVAHRRTKNGSPETKPFTI